MAQSEKIQTKKAGKIQQISMMSVEYLSDILDNFTAHEMDDMLYELLSFTMTHEEAESFGIDKTRQIFFAHMLLRQAFQQLYRDRAAA